MLEWADHRRPPGRQWPAQRLPPPPIRLQAATFRPALGQKPDILPGLMVAEPADAAYGYYLVQFAGPIQNGWKEALAGLGAETLAYVPDFAFKGRMVPGLIPQVQRLEPVTWVGAFHLMPAARALSPRPTSSLR